MPCATAEAAHSSKLYSSAAFRISAPALEYSQHGTARSAAVIAQQVAQAQREGTRHACDGRRGKTFADLT